MSFRVAPAPSIFFRGSFCNKALKSKGWLCSPWSKLFCLLVYAPLYFSALCKGFVWFWKCVNFPNDSSSLKGKEKLPSHSGVKGPCALPFEISGGEGKGSVNVLSLKVCCDFWEYVLLHFFILICYIFDWLILLPLASIPFLLVSKVADKPGLPCHGFGRLKMFVEVCCYGLKKTRTWHTDFTKALLASFPTGYVFHFISRQAYFSI